MSKKNPDSVKQKEVINFRELSRQLTGSPDKIRSDFTPKKWRLTVDAIKDTVKDIIQFSNDLEKNIKNSNEV